MQEKEDKVGHKKANKEERQRKEKERERKIEIDSEKKFKPRLVGMHEKQKAVYLRPSSRKICLLHSYAN